MEAAVGARTRRAGLALRLSELQLAAASAGEDLVLNPFRTEVTRSGGSRDTPSDPPPPQQDGEDFAHVGAAVVVDDDGGRRHAPHEKGGHGRCERRCR